MSCQSTLWQEAGVYTIVLTHAQPAAKHAMTPLTPKPDSVQARQLGAREHERHRAEADQRDPPPTIVCGGQPHAKPARADVAGNFTQPLNLPEIVPPRVQRTCEVAGAGAVHSRPHARSLDGVIDPVAPSAGAGVDSASGERAQPLALQSVRAPAPKGARGSGVAKLSNCRRKQRERRQPLHRCRRPRRPAARELATPQVGDAPTQ